MTLKDSLEKKPEKFLEECLKNRLFLIKFLKNLLKKLLDKFSRNFFIELDFCKKIMEDFFFEAIEGLPVGITERISGRFFERIVEENSWSINP